MNERTIAAMQRWLQEQKNACLQAQAALRAEGRQDEAVFQQIRANVFSLSGPVLSASMTQPDPAETFLYRMTKIPAAWEEARQKAQSHGDSVQVHLETIKLDAAEEIRAAFRRIRSEEA